ncbi:FKBP-type peptidyl-prolyl cis-trans isomerase [Demequina aurantiaca]|uniref:FKBP-type peptidyl-prolyl cis-trans isomerase n=1 Tax=Demequina aurantiaca TaxID=676200 RepID=UPI003D356FE0
MKKYWLTATTLGAVAALSLTACSSSDDSTDSSLTASPSASASATATATGVTQYGSEDDVAVLKTITWGEADGIPNLEFEAPLTVTDSTTYVSAAGDGDEIAVGDNVELEIVAIAGVDGSNLGSTYETGTSETYTMTDGAIDPALYAVLVGNNVGQTLIYATPDTSATVAEGEDIPAVFYAVTVTGSATIPDRATGDAVEPAEGLPQVTLDDDGAPSVDFTGTEMPTELVSQTLIEGDGAEVTADQTVTVNYTGWVWDGEQFDSSWDAGTPLTMPLTQLVEGWQQGLVGQKVGSQVLLVIPPELGYGDQEAGSIPAGSTLVFVVDILAAS